VSIALIPLKKRTGSSRLKVIFHDHVFAKLRYDRGVVFVSSIHPQACKKCTTHSQVEDGEM